MKRNVEYFRLKNVIIIFSEWFFPPITPLSPYQTDTQTGKNIMKIKRRLQRPPSPRPQDDGGQIVSTYRKDFKMFSKLISFTTFYDVRL